MISIYLVSNVYIDIGMGQQQFHNLVAVSAGSIVQRRPTKLQNVCLTMTNQLA